MNKVTLWLVAIFLVGAVAIAEAQQPKKIPRIGYLAPRLLPLDPARIEAFRQGLRELGYVEGQEHCSLSTDMRRESAIGSLSSRPSWCVSRLMSSLRSGARAIRAAKKATTTIPIVMATGWRSCWQRA